MMLQLMPTILLAAVVYTTVTTTLTLRDMSKLYSVIFCTLSPHNV